MKQVLGVQLQESQFPDRIRVGEALEMYSALYESPQPWRELMDELGLSHQERTAFAKLSGGQRQRLSIAVALVGNPKVAILDELTTGLDPQARRETWALVEQLRERGVTIVLVTHFMEEAERLADRVALIDRGRLIALDSPRRLVENISATQTIRFRPDAPLYDEELAGIAGVATVRWDGEYIVITGTGDVLNQVTSLLARRRIVAHHLRVDSATLDDAFLALTGRPYETQEA